MEGVREQSMYIGILQKLPWAFPALAQAIEEFGKLGFKTSFQSFLDWCSQELEARRKVSQRRFSRLEDPQVSTVAMCNMGPGSANEGSLGT